MGIQSHCQAGDVSTCESGKPPHGGALLEIDLASDTAWTLRADDGPARPIKVPGGGWNSNWQEPRIDTISGVKDYAIYERKFLVPNVAEGQVSKLSFGAVNYGAEIFIDGNRVAAHDGSLTPFVADITGFVKPGRECALTVKAYHRRHYMVPVPKPSAELSPFETQAKAEEAVKLTCLLPVSIDTPVGSENWVGCGWFGKDMFAYGITRHIKLQLFPAVHVEEIFVKPSVCDDSLTAIVSIRNSTSSEKALILSGRLTSWNNSSWPYPVIPDTPLLIPAGDAKQVVIGPVKWSLGEKSYWWPNIPFREDYGATLHNLVLEIKEAGKTWQTCTQRFGFCEHSEDSYYYKVNGVRVFQIGDVTTESQIGYYDAYSTLPAFLPPTGLGTGCPETWKKYMRCGINSNRVSCNLPTEYMLETADEVGFMLIPEAVNFGNNTAICGEPHARTVREMGRLCRNHPCVMRYSLGNEFRGEMEPWRPLIDAMLEVDDTRPLIFECQGIAGRKFEGVNRGHAFDSVHYGEITQNPHTSIYNMGEFGSGSDFMAEFAIAAVWMRLYDWAYVAPWCWLNYWPNFFEGMDRSKHVQDIYHGIDRHDNVNGWGSPVVRLVQRALHPYLLLDIGLMEDKENQPPVVGWQGFKAETPWHEVGHGDVYWPRRLPTCAGGENVSRRIEVFNGGLSGNQLFLRWSCRWDGQNGTVAIPGETVGPLEIKPGFHVTQEISFVAPMPDRDERRMYLVMESIKDDAVVFTEDRLFFINYLNLR